jgi:hypothetical protein
VTTTTADAPVGARVGRAADPTIRQRLHRGRWLLATGAVLLVACLALALYGSGARGGNLDPRSYDPGGSHALSALLGDRGVTVTATSDLATALNAAHAGDTLVVVRPQYLDADELEQVAGTPADLVVVAADSDVVVDLGGITALPAVKAADADDTETIDPACALRAAQVAGPAELGDEIYTSVSGVSCYPINGGYGLLRLADSGRSVTFLGDAAPLQNSSLADEGNAALAVGLLDAHPHVEWLVPLAESPQAATSGQSDVTDLLPARLKFAFDQLVIAVIVIALWRGRRFGRLVREELPVVVRRAEVVVGRARLYQRSKARGTAADALRGGSRDRMSRRLGFGVHPNPAALIDAVAARTQRPASDVAQLLYGATPVDDHGLIALAHALSALEQEVSRT